MGDKPILFSSAMVRALLDGRKTQTRRVIRQQPEPNVTSAGTYFSSETGHSHEWTWLSGDPRDCDTWHPEGDFKLPYAIGDRLWVREAFCYAEPAYHPYVNFDFRDPSKPTRAVMHREGCWDQWPKEFGYSWKPSIHMPRWASRLTLTVTDVRVQRVQEITADDADAEVFGGDFPYRVLPDLFLDPDRAGDMSIPECFGVLWDSINAKRGYGWDANPWVAAYTFTVERGNIEELANA